MLQIIQWFLFNLTTIYLQLEGKTTTLHLERLKRGFTELLKSTQWPRLRREYHFQKKIIRVA